MQRKTLFVENNVIEQKEKGENCHYSRHNVFVLSALCRTKLNKEIERQTPVFCCLINKISADATEYSELSLQRRLRLKDFSNKDMEWIIG